MAGYTSYSLPERLVNEWGGGAGSLRVVNLTTSSQTVTVTVYREGSVEDYELSTLGDSIAVDLAGVDHFEIEASSYPAVVLYLFGDDATAELLEAPRVIVQSGIVTISGTVTATVSGTVGVSAVGGVVNVAGSVTVSSISTPVTVTGSVTATVSGTVGVSAVGGVVNVAGSVTVSNTIAVTGTVDIGTISGSVTISAGTVDIGTISGDVSVGPASRTFQGSGHKSTVAANTRVALKGVSTPAAVIMLKADRANLDTLYAGNSAVTANETEGTGGLQLEPGDAIVFPATNLQSVYIVSPAANGDGVSFMYWT